MKVKVRMDVKTHLLRHMYEAYAERILKENPSYWGRRSMSIRNYYVYRMISAEDGPDRVEEITSYRRFRDVVEAYLQRAKDAVIQGQALSMGHGLGKICARRVERDFRKEGQRKVNWGATRKQPMVLSPVTGNPMHKRVYHTEDDWCRIGWHKQSKLQNETVYGFFPADKNSAGTSGFKLEFTRALDHDPLLKYKYLFIPVQP